MILNFMRKIFPNSQICNPQTWSIHSANRSTSGYSWSCSVCTITLGRSVEDMGWHSRRNFGPLYKLMTIIWPEAVSWSRAWKCSCKFKMEGWKLISNGHPSTCLVDKTMPLGQLLHWYPLSWGLTDKRQKAEIALTPQVLCQPVCWGISQTTDLKFW